MYLTSTLRRTLAVGGISLLAVVGLIGWTREEGHRASPATSTYTASPNWYAPQAPTGRDSGARIVYGPSPFGSELARPVDPEPVAATVYAPAAVQAGSQTRIYRTRSGKRHYVVVKKRPFKHSAAIVGGAAAGGALIGALAGGGKGAAIGALAGGGSGLVYDRLTAKKKIVR